MFVKKLILFPVVLFTSVHVCYAELSVCSNRVINEVTTRVGCTVGDSKCWFSKGGFCTDYVEKKARRGQSGKAIELKNISSEDVKKGDVAQFVSRAHYAYVESVVRGKDGKLVAVNLSEYNYGTCLVDEQSMVTEKYKIVNKRTGVPVKDIDGGFMRPYSK